MTRPGHHRAASAAVRGAAMVVGALALVASQPARAAVVEISVTGIEHARGHIRVAVCTRDTFLKPTCPYQGVAEAKEGETVVQVDGVPPGLYAVQAFQDETDAGVVHQNLLGVPREPVGFSNDAPLHARGPRFSDAAFAVTNSVERITLKLRRLFHSAS
jgi:uncharacterized protein (DUF2141 family)